MKALETAHQGRPLVLKIRFDYERVITLSGRLNVPSDLFSDLNEI